MKRPALLYSAEILLFIVLIAGAITLLAPVSRLLDRALDSLRNEVGTRLENATGLRITYSELSPSVFRSIRIKDLVVADAGNGVTLAKIADVSVTYSFFSLLRGKPAAGIREIVLENGYVLLDGSSNGDVIRRLRSISRTGSTSGDAGDGEAESKPFSIDDLFPSPVNVRIHNLELGYRDTLQSARVSIIDGIARLDSEGIALDFDSRVAYERSGFEDLGPIQSRLSLKGKVDRAFSNGSASLTLRSLESKKFSVSRLGLVTSFLNGVVTVNSIQDLQPVDVGLVWNIPAQDLFMTMVFERLLPLKWISLSGNGTIPAGLKETETSGKLTLHVGKDDALDYGIDLTADFPASLYSGGRLAVRVSGDSSLVRFDEVSLKGSRYDISFNGLYDIKDRIPEGLLEIRRCVLPSGTGVTGELYAQRDGSGFECIIPNLSVGETGFSSVSLSVKPGDGSPTEFTLSANDTTGHIGAEGSFTGGEGGFLQAYTAFDSVDARNLSRFILGLASENGAPGLDALDGWGVTTEVFVSTDLSSFSFNCTRLVMASSKAGGNFILLSAKGNERGIDITDISVSPGSNSILGNIHAGYESSGDIIFNADFSVNSIPYNLSGIYGDQTLSVYGDYDLAVSVDLDSSDGISGVFRVNSLPIPVGSLMLSASIDSAFTVRDSDDWKVTVKNGLVEELGGFTLLSTKAAFAGTIEPGGAFLHELAFSDSYSTVSGFARLSEIPGEGSDTRYRAEVRLASSDEKESYSLEGTLTQAEELYFEAGLSVSSFPLMRFVREQNSDNTLFCNLTCSGTVSNLLATADIQYLSYKMAGFNLESYGNLIVEDRQLSLYNAGLSWNGQTLTSIKASLSMDTLEASLSAAYVGVLDDDGLTGTIAANFSPELLKDGSGEASFLERFKRYTLDVTADKIKWNTIQPAEPFTCTLVHEPGITAIYAGKDDVITGFYLDDGVFSLHAGESSPVRFNADGAIMGSSISITVDDIRVDMARLWPFTGIDLIMFESGIAEGSVVISGLLNDPDFIGSLKTHDVTVVSPGFVLGSYSSDPFDIIVSEKSLSANGVVVRGADGVIYASAVALFDRWIPTRCDLKVLIPPDSPLPMDTENPYFKAAGDVSGDVNLSFSNEEGISVIGDASFEKGSFAVVFSEFNRPQEPVEGDTTDLLVRLKLNIGKKVEFRWPTDDFPILRGLIQADKPVEIVIDSLHDSFSFKGEATLRGGELFYIKRSFYLRQGSISFNENQARFDPILSLRAEIRERDEDGEPVRIILLVENQPLTSFVPVLYSDPPKASDELMVLLGQAASGDSSRDSLLQNTVVTASDIFTQMGLFRTAENRVRDVLNVDIFSIRTLLLQNAIFGQAMQGSSSKEMTIGNYFDNTTVYMGKYFGSAVYADALLHFSYYDAKSVENTESKTAVYGNMLFQPELGLEVATPFFLVRWGIAPSNLDNLLIGDTSVTLSWKFSY